MSEAPFIKRRDRKKLERGFDALRREGLELAQQMSGKQWTDYNLHDPGVTILEQVLYALTELNYRASFGVADYLVDDSGTINYQHQAIYKPEQAFPCRPTTEVDYRKAILSEVGELDNVWLIPSEQEIAESDTTNEPQQTKPLGLHRIALKMKHGLNEVEKREVKERVEGFYHAQRNLCEDLEEISHVQGQDYELWAEIEVSSRSRPVDILASIYFECSRRIAGGISLYGYDTFLKQGESLDTLFSGPFSPHGVYKDEDFRGNQTEFSVTSLYALINALDGVDHVRDVYLKQGDEIFNDVISSGSPETAFNLLIPGEENAIKVTLTANGRELPVDEDEVRAKYDELNFMYYSARTSSPDISQVYRLPTGVSRPLADYASIQDQFPNTYAIGTYGVPDSEPDDVKARAKQLKAYLLLFEQVMANYLANLGAIRSLFSIDYPSDGSYATAVLTEKQIGGVNELYPQNPKEVLNDILDKFDNSYDRKSRLLDYLLALYGESFSQNSLRHFNDYYSQQEVSQIIVKNKADFLHAAIELGRDRVGAANYTGDTWATRARSGLQQRVSILLGFKNRTARSLTMAILKQGLKLTRHSEYERLKAGSADLELIDATRLAKAGFEQVPGLEIPEPYSIAEVRSHIEETLPLKNNLLSELLLHGGIYLPKYSLGSLTGDETYQLTVQTQDQRHWFLGTYDDKQKGVAAANALRRFLIQLNVESEGLHILEHLLLRPENGMQHAGIELPDDEDFYSFRISVILPGWTARCHNTQFRKLAEETIRKNAPAHVYPEFYWLSFLRMYEFEVLYEKWMTLKSRPQYDGEALNEASAKLLTFLLKERHGAEVQA
ncbi:hypothetical protein ACFL2V_06900 [Pseudomonadota bacterium]